MNPSVINAIRLTNNMVMPSTLSADSRFGIPMPRSRLKSGFANHMKRLALSCLVAAGVEAATAEVDLGAGFLKPPASARPWVYWFWLDGNITKEGITADLEAMRQAGLGGALWMWGGGVGEGVKGPVKFLGPAWWDLMRHTVQEADRLGLKINLTAGSGWSHTGGPWIKPEHSMRRLESSQEIRWTGPGLKEVTIPDADTLVAVLAYPLKGDTDRMRRAGVNPLLMTSAYPFQGQPSWNVQIAEVQLLQQGEPPLQKDPLNGRSVVDLTAKCNSAGRLSWEVPAGTWTLQVFHHRSTGDQPHPILPDEGGLECDKLSPAAVHAHWDGYIRRVLDECGPAARRVIQWVHADSYEFGPQTWTPKFREEFQRRCGYDPRPYCLSFLEKSWMAPRFPSVFCGISGVCAQTSLRKGSAAIFANSAKALGWV